MVSIRVVANDAEGNGVPLRLTIYRPVEKAPGDWVCAYRIRCGQETLAEAEAPGTEKMSALYTCFVMLARAVEHLSESHKLKWSYHDLWWVRHIMPQQHDA